MNSDLLRLCMLGVALLSGQASAVGFGEIILHSRMGEALKAEVPIFTNAPEELETACFSLAPLQASDIPVISYARMHLLRSDKHFRLIISGQKPITEPVFILALRAGCGSDLQRDYVLMPAGPLESSQDTGNTALTLPIAAKAKPARFSEVIAGEGDTLETIAENRLPGNIIEQRRLLAAIKRANPTLPADHLLAAGTTVRIPRLQQKIRAENITVTGQANQDNESALPSPGRRAARSDASPSPQLQQGQDRLVIAPPPEDKSAHTTAQSSTERMLKLETSLSLLSQEVDKLNTALTLTTETLIALEKLKTAESLLQTRKEAPSTRPSAIPAPPLAERSKQKKWLELVLSALLGGGIATGIAYFLGRRQTQTAAAPTGPWPPTSIWQKKKS